MTCWNDREVSPPTERLYHSVPFKPTQYLKRNVQPTQKYDGRKLVSCRSRGGGGKKSRVKKWAFTACKTEANSAIKVILVCILVCFF